MVAKSVIEINVEDKQFRDFHALFEKYEKQLSEMPEGWNKVTGSVEDAGAEMSEFTDSAMSSKQYMMAMAIQADALSKAMLKATGVQDKFNTRAKDGAIQMGKMHGFSSSMHKNFTGMSSTLLKLGSGAGTVASGIAAAVVGAITAVYKATNVVAGQNLEARGLGLKIGQTQSFSANFEKFGLGASDLGTVANAQGDASKWRAMLAVGLTPQQIQSEDAEQLTYDFSRAASGKYRQWQKSGAPAASMAQAYGLTDFLSLQQLRAGSSRSDEEWQQAQKKEIDVAKKAEIDQGTADSASDVKAALASDWAEVVNAFDKELVKAAPLLEKLADAATKAAFAILKLVGPLFTPPANVVPSLPTEGTPMDKLLGWREYDHSSFNDIEKNNNLPQGLLYAQMMTESRGNVNAKSPAGALGPFQFMPGTARQYGISDPFNMYQSSAGAGKMDSDLSKRYGGDIRKALAAYNWGMGNVDKDIKAHGNQWEQYAPKETQDYVRKITALMAKNNKNVHISITNSTPSRVAVSLNAAQH